jgi:hypothetical protein
MSSNQKVGVLLPSMGREHDSRGDFRRKSLTLDKPPMVGRSHAERRRSSFTASSVSTSAGVGTEKIERRASFVHR